MVWNLVFLYATKIIQLLRNIQQNLRMIRPRATRGPRIEKTTNLYDAD